MADPALLNRRQSHRYVGSPDNASRIETGYSARTRKISLLDKTRYCKSIEAVMKNLENSLTYVASDGTLLNDRFEYSYKDRSRATISFDFVCALPEPPFMACYSKFMLAIAQFIVMTFNQLEVDLSEFGDDDDDDIDPDEAASRDIIVDTCERSIAMASALVTDPSMEDFNPVQAHIGPAINDDAMRDICAVLHRLVEGAQPQMSVAYTRNLITIQHDEAPNAITVELNLEDPIKENYTIMVVYNANIAAAVLAAKKGKLNQLRELKSVLDCFSRYVLGGPLVNASNAEDPAPLRGGSVNVRARFSR